MRRLFLSITALFLAVSPASAASYTVNSGGDSPGCPSACTLREAVGLANANPGADTIVLNVTAVVFSQVGTEDANASGDLDITETVTLQPASGITRVTINGGASGAGGTHDRVFDVLGSAGLVLYSIDVTNGSTTGDGGCIRAANDLQLNDTTITQCDASGDGGGVWVGNNLTSNGDVLFAADTGYDGGGAFVTSRWETGADLTFANNVAANDGGGLYIEGELDVAATWEFTGNVASGNGGALWSSDQIAIDGLSTDSLYVYGNAAYVGGGFYLVGDYNSLGASNGYSVTFEENAADDAGGGIYVGGDDGFSVTSAEFLANTSTHNGAGLFVSSAIVDLYDTSFLGNVVSGGSGADGGGAYLYGNTSVSVHGGTFEENVTPRSGGGVFSWYIYTLALDDVGFEANEAEDGAGMYLDTDNLAVERCSFVGNVASDEGGGIYIDYCDPSGTGDCTIRSTTFSGNDASYAHYGDGLIAQGTGRGSLNLDFVTTEDGVDAYSGFPVLASRSVFEAQCPNVTDVADNYTAGSSGCMGSADTLGWASAISACGSSNYTRCKEPTGGSDATGGASSGCTGVAQNGTTRTGAPCEAGAAEL